MERKIDRLDKYLKMKGLSDNKVTVTAGLSVGTLGKSRNEGRDLSDSTIEKVLKSYSDLSKVWLLTGEGEMIKSGNETGQGKRYEGHVIRYYDVEATAGNIEMVEEPSAIYKAMMISGFEDCEVALNVWGDSMYPELKSGQIVALKEWRESYIEYGHTYLVVTKNNHRMIKRLRRAADAEEVTCESANSLYDTFQIKRADILKLFLVKGHIERSVI